MASRDNSIRQLDLFVPALSNIQLRDQREVMERPFFSLSKRKRLTPINYNTVHFTSTMAAVKSIRMMGCDARGRSG